MSAKKFLDFSGLQSYHDNLISLIRNDEQVIAQAIEGLASDMEANEEVIATALNDLKETKADKTEVRSLPSNYKQAEDQLLYVERENGDYTPVSHPDLSTQPSIISERFGKYPIKEVLLPFDQTDDPTPSINSLKFLDNEFIYFKDGQYVNGQILNCTLFGNGITTSSTCIKNKSNQWLLFPTVPLDNFKNKFEYGLFKYIEDPVYGYYYQWQSKSNEDIDGITEYFNELSKNSIVGVLKYESSSDRVYKILGNIDNQYYKFLNFCDWLKQNTRSVSYDSTKKTIEDSENGDYILIPDFWYKNFYDDNQPDEIIFTNNIPSGRDWNKFKSKLISKTTKIVDLNTFDGNILPYPDYIILYIISYYYTWAMDSVLYTSLLGLSNFCTSSEFINSEVGFQSENGVGLTRFNNFLYSDFKVGDKDESNHFPITFEAANSYGSLIIINGINLEFKSATSTLVREFIPANLIIDKSY